MDIQHIRMLGDALLGTVGTAGKVGDVIFIAVAPGGPHGFGVNVKCQRLRRFVCCRAIVSCQITSLLVY